MLVISRGFMKVKHSQNTNHEAATQVNTSVHGYRFISMNSVIKPGANCIFNKASRKFSINGGTSVSLH